MRSCSAMPCVSIRYASLISYDLRPMRLVQVLLEGVGAVTLANFARMSDVDQSSSAWTLSRRRDADAVLQRRRRRPSHSLAACAHILAVAPYTHESRTPLTVMSICSLVAAAGGVARRRMCVCRS